MALCHTRDSNIFKFSIYDFQYVRIGTGLPYVCYAEWAGNIHFSFCHLAHVLYMCLMWIFLNFTTTSSQISYTSKISLNLPTNKRVSQLCRKITKFIHCEVNSEVLALSVDANLPLVDACNMFISNTIPFIIMIFKIKYTI